MILEPKLDLWSSCALARVSSTVDCSVVTQILSKGHRCVKTISTYFLKYHHSISTVTDIVSNIYNFSVDKVLSIKCLKWPKIAREWVTRESASWLAVIGTHWTHRDRRVSFCDTTGKGSPVEVFFLKGRGATSQHVDSNAEILLSHSPFDIERFDKSIPPESRENGRTWERGLQNLQASILFVFSEDFDALEMWD